MSCLKLSDWTAVHLSRLSYCFWDCDWKMAFAYYRTFLSQSILLLVDHIFNRLINRHSDLSTSWNCSMNLKYSMDRLIEFYLYKHRGFLDLLRCVYTVDHCRCCFVFFFYGMAVVKRWKEIAFPSMRDVMKATNFHDVRFSSPGSLFFVWVDFWSLSVTGLGSRQPWEPGGDRPGLYFWVNSVWWM